MTEPSPAAKLAGGVNRPAHLAFAYCAIAYVVTLCLGLFVVAGWLPPVAPRVEGASLVALFEAHRLQIRIGVTILVGSVLFWWPFSAAISAQLRRIEGPHAIFAPVQLAAAAGISLITLFGGYAWLVAAFREHPDPATVQILSDYAWLTFVGAWPTAILQSLAIGICILTAKASQVVYPRWVGYLNLWMSGLYAPGLLAPFFHGGPFAWNGAITFYTVAVAYFGYIMTMCWTTVRAIKSWNAQ